MARADKFTWDDSKGLKFKGSGPEGPIAKGPLPSHGDLKKQIEMDVAKREGGVPKGKLNLKLWQGG